MLRIGIVGAGSMGERHAASWANTEAQIAGISSRNLADAQKLATAYKAVAYASYADLLANVDLIDICTPTHLHHEMVLQAADAGIHIICEKPLARTVVQAEEMIAACKKAGVKLLVAHVVRFFPEYALAQQKVAAGEIGKPAVMRFKRGSSQPYKPTDNWFVDMDRAGGMMLDLMIHDLDYARWLGGEVKTVMAKSIRQEHGTDVDHALVILTHESGAISHVEGSWAYPPPLFWTQFEIAGSKGLIQHDSAKAANAGIFHHANPNTDRPEVPLPSSALHEDPYTTQLKSFYSHLMHNTPIPVTAEDGLAALKIALAALESAQTGQPVSL